MLQERPGSGSSNSVAARLVPMQCTLRGLYCCGRFSCGLANGCRVERSTLSPHDGHGKQHRCTATTVAGYARPALSRGMGPPAAWHAHRVADPRDPQRPSVGPVLARSSPAAELRKAHASIHYAPVGQVAHLTPFAPIRRRQLVAWPLLIAKG